ncbi:hypothetical protein P171DRAFT_485166 [Karstenula rhodostoma CBS 690.94]|uniref:Cytochrome P450 n=1 Tax=Karstenula rhodostoma CBS 690.94 TaxID=1392251 RepID=A0A9P4UB13_9PLEO|nr:hypothetical protein P171DRAFT_485166 [Karstenula rhodostoma CBS 690.94]
MEKALSEITQYISIPKRHHVWPAALRLFVDEAHRICPLTPGTLWRELSAGDPGSTEPLLIDDLYTIHHNEEHFSESFVYRPERWLDEGETAETMTARKKLREGFSPFGLGSRSYAGKAVAYVKPVLL